MANFRCDEAGWKWNKKLVGIVFDAWNINHFTQSIKVSSEDVVLDVAEGNAELR